MSFDAQEVSAASGQPVELFEFRQGSESFFYTSQGNTIRVDGQDYQSRAIVRRAMKLGQDQRQEGLEVQIPGNDPMLAPFRNVVSSKDMRLKVIQVHRNDGVDPEKRVWFNGTVQGVSFREKGRIAVMSCLSISGSAARRMLRFTYSNMCQHMLYDGICRVARNGVSPLRNQFFGGGIPFREVRPVSAVSGRDMDLGGLFRFPPNWFTGGFISIDGEIRGILFHGGNKLTLMEVFTTNVIGKTATVQAGCPHTLKACLEKFDNTINYGGHPFVPTKNPVISHFLPGAGLDD